MSAFATKDSHAAVTHEIDRSRALKKYRSYLPLRRAQDIVLSLLALVILFPFMLLLAIIIWIDSPGASPVFVQDRVGMNGKHFHLYKFRSMCPHAENMLPELMDQNEMDGPVFKIREDPRITRVGRVIRKISVDELPQLLNILRGDMSIVGPRPALPREVEQYDAYARQRLDVLPGLTCYWQITPKRNTLTFHQWLDLDLRYIENCSFLEDWKIILKTVGVCLGGQGV